MAPRRDTLFGDRLQRLPDSQDIAAAIGLALRVDTGRDERDLTTGWKGSADETTAN
jgi:hypothetical protein